MRKYISVDEQTNDTHDEIHMDNESNVVCGTLKTKDSNNQLKDVKEIFIDRSAFDGVDDLTIEGEPEGEFDMEQMVAKYNQLVAFLKNITTMALVGISLVLPSFGDDYDGKAKLGKIKANQYVVTNEVDKVFTTWRDGVFSPFFYSLGAWRGQMDDWRTNSTFNLPNKKEVLVGLSDPKSEFKFVDTNDNVTTLGDLMGGMITQEVDPEFTAWKNMRTGPLSIGYNSQTTYGGVVLGYPGNWASISSKENPNSNIVQSWIPGGTYSHDFDGVGAALNSATAVGQGAKAEGQVSVAIGNRAMASGIHTSSTNTFQITLKHRQIETIKQGSAVVSVTTNEQNVATTMDAAEWESKPYGSGSFSQVNSQTTTLPNGNTKTTVFYEETVSGLRDPRYATPEEYQMYDVYFNPGQPNTHFAAATYGVAVGYRSLAGAYHTLALGHYARATRPSSVAIGPSSHILSEGSIGLGYYNNIQPSSPFSLAIGSRISIPSCMTNAIVIGVPTMDFNKRKVPGYNQGSNPYIFTSSPRPVKSNSINFVFNGNGLEDVFVDNVAMTDRMATDMKVVGNCGGTSTSKAIKGEVNQLAGIQDNDESMVLFSWDGGVKIFTKGYFDAKDEYIEGSGEPDPKGFIEDIEINGMNLKSIIERHARSAAQEQMAAFKQKVQVAANTASQAIEDANNAAQMKMALKTFFDTIKQ